MKKGYSSSRLEDIGAEILGGTATIRRPLDSILPSIAVPLPVNRVRRKPVRLVERKTDRTHW